MTKFPKVAVLIALSTSVSFTSPKITKSQELIADAEPSSQVRKECLRFHERDEIQTAFVHKLAKRLLEGRDENYKKFALERMVEDAYRRGYGISTFSFFMALNEVWGVPSFPELVALAASCGHSLEFNRLLLEEKGYISDSVSSIARMVNDYFKNGGMLLMVDRSSMILRLDHYLSKIEERAPAMLQTSSFLYGAAEAGLAMFEEEIAGRSPLRAVEDLYYIYGNIARILSRATEKRTFGSVRRSSKPRSFLGDLMSNAGEEEATEMERRVTSLSELSFQISENLGRAMEAARLRDNPR